MAFKAITAQPDIYFDAIVCSRYITVFYLPAKQIKPGSSEHIVTGHGTVITGQFRSFSAVEGVIYFLDLLIRVRVVIEYG